VERSREPMDKNRIEGAAEQGERARNRKALVRSYPGRSRLVPERATVTNRSEKSAEAKSAMGSVTKRKFLGYNFWFARGGVKRKVAKKPLATFKQKIRQLTRRSGGRGMAEVIERLRPYLLGWKAYFGLAQTPGVWRMLDEWLRHRLRAIQLKHWKRGQGRQETGTGTGVRGRS
jgi:hypothetical protein